MATTEAMREWVARVLGVELAEAGNAPEQRDLPAEFRTAVEHWNASLARIDRQMAVLKSALLSSGDPDLEEIAEYQLDSVLGDGLGKLTTILRKLAGADEAALRSSAARILSALQATYASLVKNDKVAACEANPVKVPVSIRAALRPEVERLQGVLSTAGGI